MIGESAVAVITEFKKPLEIWKVPIPDLEPGAGLLKIEAATLCGTDAHRWSGHFSEMGDADLPFVQPFRPPYVPGHEMCGSIAAFRGEIRDITGKALKEGDRVITSYAHCGRCYYCQVARQTTLCHDVVNYGQWDAERLLGGCAEYQRVLPQSSLIRVPAHVPAAVAASASCALRTVMHGFELLGPIAPHESVLVLGSGPLGLYALAVALDKGASEALVIGAPEARLAVASKWGASECLDLTKVTEVQERIDWVRARTGGRGTDIVINCATSHALSEAIRMVRPGGRIVQIGVSGGAPVQIAPVLMFRGVTIHTTVMAEARHFYQAIDFVASRQDRYDFSMMISREFALKDTGEALRGMAEMSEVKPVIFPHGKP